MTVGPLGTAGGMYRYIIGIFTRRTLLGLKRHFQNFSSVASSSSGGAVPFSVSRSISTSMYLPGGGASPADAPLERAAARIAINNGFRSDGAIKRTLDE